MSARELGFDEDRLEALTRAVEADVAAERYDGAVMLVARRGEIALHRAVGFAERASQRPAHTDDVFCLFSVTKTFTSAAVLRRVDRGEIRLTTPVAEIVPEFGVKGKQRVTVAQLLTHTGGLSSELPPIPMEELGNLQSVAAAVCDQPLISAPGRMVSYSPIGAHAVLGELVRRLDGGGRSFRDILTEELFEPLGMKDTALGLRADLAARRVPVVVRDRRPGLFVPELLEAMNVFLDETAEIPGGGAVSTANDVFRWAEALRGGGALGGVRILSPAILALAAQNHTGDEPNHIFDYARELRGWDPYPACLGLGFFLRGEGIFPNGFGVMASPGTFGGLGAGSTMFWVDPERELVFVCLTAGLIEESHNIDRLQRLSDLVFSALTD
ncbi:MAG: beta-lactamase family protein [Deltaproteobacteria bacterium]|nr:MAG: beta-lactamase family protein [Deltaproteobacteria bacterium]